MPFCRKCGRYLPEYSESCSDCGQSTTSPIINIKKRPSSKLNFKAAPVSKIAKVMIPKKTTITIKNIAPNTDPNNIKPQGESVKISTPKTPVNVTATIKEAISVSQAKVVGRTKATPILQAKNTSTETLTPIKPVAPPKPFFSAKHIIKPKKVTPKPTTPNTIVTARSVAPFTTNEPKPVALPIPVNPPVPIVPPNPIPQSAPLIPIKPAQQSKPINPATVYPLHKIIKSTVSLKEDFLTNPQDYETRPFNFNLKCPNDHFWSAGKALPVSNDKALCPKCGELLRKPKPKRRQRYRKSLF
jgi:rRNA maturation protein Nop10